MNVPAALRVRELLDYSPLTGLLTWRLSRGRAPAGSVAGTTNTLYVFVRIDGVRYTATNLIWLIVFGVSPDGEVDHKNHDRRDNRLDNLRDLTRGANQQNQIRAQVGNHTGLLGVSKADSTTNPYRARIFTNGAVVHLGGFASADAAHAAYVSAKRSLHPGGVL